MIEYLLKNSVILMGVAVVIYLIFVKIFASKEKHTHAELRANEEKLEIIKERKEDIVREIDGIKKKKQKVPVHLKEELISIQNEEVQIRKDMNLKEEQW